MSYDHRLLFRGISQSLSQSPSSSLARLSRELQVSPRTIEMAVATMTGKTFRDVREEILMATVRCLFVSNSALAVKELSQRVGYKSASSFARAIRRACGLCPEELRFRMAREEMLAMRIPKHVA